MAEANETSKQRQKRLAKEKKKNFRKRQKVYNIECSEIICHDLKRMNQLCFYYDAKF